MQNTNEQQKSVKRGTLIKYILLLTVLCSFALICGQTIPKSANNYNTNLPNGEIIRKHLTDDRMLTGEFKQTVDGNAYVRIGGRPIGISVNAGGLIVLGQCEVLTDGGAVYPARESGIEIGDVIISVGNTAIRSVYGLKKALEDEKSATVELTVSRSGDMYKINIAPAIDRLTGQKKLGLMLKEDVGGVGTLTFVTQDGKFGALGHYIIDTESGLSEELDDGNIYATSVDGVVKGERGKAGGLVAEVNRLSQPIGSIYKNTNIGIYGEFNAEYDGDLYKIAAKGEAKPGAAQVFTTIDGSEPKFYDIDIVKVVSQSEAGEKGMVISVRDKELLEKTGGIVQGMSGSPIVQNGILVGAVTHVFVQDPTRGYAVHSRFMYDYATETSEADGNLKSVA